jgi:hypothetical protein
VITLALALALGGAAAAVLMVLAGVVRMLGETDDEQR